MEEYNVVWKNHNGNWWDNPHRYYKNSEKQEEHKHKQAKKHPETKKEQKDRETKRDGSSDTPSNSSFVLSTIETKENKEQKKRKILKPKPCEIKTNITRQGNLKKEALSTRHKSLKQHKAKRKEQI
jgi:hypothetical protein